jgi:nanoRNase/pAp phosphatase (c-di-AMP/oligoRNAs hydrolase)
MVTWYLRAARLKPNPRVATALFYGIKTDTLGLSRASHDEDTRVYVYLQKYLDREALMRIENASVPAGYFRALDKALHRTRVQNGLVVARLGEMPYPDMAAEVADFLGRLEGTKVTVAVGQYAGDVVISVRSPERGPKLDELVQTVIRGDGSAGGHDYSAAGRVPATLAGSAEDTEEEMVRRFAHALGLRQYNPVPLVP